MTTTPRHGARLGSPVEPRSPRYAELLPWLVQELALGHAAPTARLLHQRAGLLAPSRGLVVWNALRIWQRGIAQGGPRRRALLVTAASERHELMRIEPALREPLAIIAQVGGGDFTLAELARVEPLAAAFVQEVIARRIACAASDAAPDVEPVAGLILIRS